MSTTAGPASETPAAEAPGRSGLGFAVAGAVIVLVLAAWTWPARMGFQGNFFGDPGANLTVQALVRRGLRPTIDFVYQYGLLSLLFGRAWFALFRATPASYHASGVAFGLWTVVSLARVVRAGRIGPAGSVLLLVGLPYFVQSPYATFAQGLEACLLCSALAAQAEGRRGAALAWATAAVLAKPNLGFVLGFLLVVLMGRDAIRGRWPVRTLVGPAGFGPAIATAAAGLAVLTTVYGVTPVARTVVPTAGLANYRAAHFGFFFGIGREFWHPAGKRPGYYLGGAAGFWIVGSLTLIAAGLVAARRLARDGADRIAEMVATCALTHAVFVSLLYGHVFTWYYDSYVLGVGLACASRLGPGWRRWTWGLVVLAAVGNRANVVGAIPARRMQPMAEAGGLRETPEGRDEWSRVLDLTRGRRWALLAISGCGELMAPGVEPPEHFFLMTGLEDAPEVHRKAGQLAAAEVVVTPKFLGGVPLAAWHRLSDALAPFEVIHDGAFYRVYRRP